jgi:hypothetical protein
LPARLIYRVHHGRRRGKDRRKGFTETGCAAAPTPHLSI